MIKRAGVEVVDPRSKDKKIAQETLSIIKKKSYINLNGDVVDISSSLDAAINGTKFYQEAMPLKTFNFKKCTIEVTNETTAQAAVRLLSEGKQDIVALNFASARNPGGGFLSGALAQEEDLCRCSALYTCIKSKPIFYNENILCDNTYYTDNIIYSPKVPFFRNEHNMLLDKPFELSIISAPAPNVRAMDKVDFEELDFTLTARALKILEVAEFHGHKTIVLGAWGCGAFGNSPEVVSDVFMDALNQISAFEHVCFAVYDTREPPVLFETFQKVCK